MIGIVEKHGGFVNVQSEVGKGTQFQVYLPAIKERTTQEVDKSELLNGKGELILIVDDETAILEITKTSLEDHNYKTFTASNGIEAISLYAEHKNTISVVLMDMMMPSMDGLTTIRILQQMNKQVKVVAISGMTSNSELAEVTEVGVNVFLRKPYTFHELLHAINNVLSKP